LKDRVVEMAKQ